MLGDVEVTAPSEPIAVGASGRPSILSRLVVHVGLVLGFLGAAAILLLFGIADRNTIHVVIGCVFFGLVVVHLAQRRHTVKRLATRLRPGARAKRQRRLAVSDVVLVGLGASVLASGIWDYASGVKHDLPINGLSLGYHTVAGVLLACSLVGHVLRRRRRFIRSTVR